jgi:hypothetical protein
MFSPVFVFIIFFAGETIYEVAMGILCSRAIRRGCLLDIDIAVVVEVGHGRRERETRLGARPRDGSLIHSLIDGLFRHS